MERFTGERRRELLKKIQDEIVHVQLKLEKYRHDLGPLKKSLENELDLDTKVRIERRDSLTYLLRDIEFAENRVNILLKRQEKIEQEQNAISYFYKKCVQELMDSKLCFLELSRSVGLAQDLSQTFTDSVLSYAEQARLDLCEEEEKEEGKLDVTHSRPHRQTVLQILRQSMYRRFAPIYVPQSPRSPRSPSPTSPRGSPRGSPRIGSPLLLNSPVSSPRLSPRGSPRGSPRNGKRSPRASPRNGRRSPRNGRRSPQGSPRNKRSPRGSPRNKRSPQNGRKSPTFRPISPSNNDNKDNKLSVVIPPNSPSPRTSPNGSIFNRSVKINQIENDEDNVMSAAFPIEHPDSNLSLRWIYGITTKGVSNNLQYDADGHYVYTASQFGVVMTREKPRRQFFQKSHRLRISAFAMHPNRLVVATGETAMHLTDKNVENKDTFLNTLRPRIIVWSTRHPNERYRIISFHDHGIKAMSFDNQDRLISVGVGGSQTLAIHSYKTGQLLFTSQTSLETNHPLKGVSWVSHNSSLGAPSDGAFVTYVFYVALSLSLSLSHAHMYTHTAQTIFSASDSNIFRSGNLAPKYVCIPNVQILIILHKTIYYSSSHTKGIPP